MASNTVLWVGGGLVLLYLMSRGGLGMGARPGGTPASYYSGMYGGAGGGGLTPTGYTPGTYGGYGGGGLTPASYGGGAYGGGYGGAGTTYA